MLTKDPQKRPTIQAVLQTLYKPPFLYYFGASPRYPLSGRCCQNQRRIQVNPPGEMRRSRTGWGCGFCSHFTADWPERRSHLAYHFDHEARTMSDWNHSVLILSLLRRPVLLVEWNQRVARESHPIIGFGWDPETTSSSKHEDINPPNLIGYEKEDYTGSDHSRSLQEALGTYTPNQDAAALANAAFSLTVKKMAEPL
jgi:hypothetical protein